MSPSYSTVLYTPSLFQERVNRVATTLAGIEFGHIAVRGSSGAIFGGALSVKMGKPLVYVRKGEESSHGYRRLEGRGLLESWIFVDDFICNGKTLRAVRDAIKEESPSASFVGVITYQDGDRGTGDRFIPANHECLTPYLNPREF